jgi:hypothetical protein
VFLLIFRRSQGFDLSSVLISSQGSRKEKLIHSPSVAPDAALSVRLKNGLRCLECGSFYYLCRKLGHLFTESVCLFESLEIDAKKKRKSRFLRGEAERVV